MESPHSLTKDDSILFLHRGSKPVAKTSESQHADTDFMEPPSPQRH